MRACVHVHARYISYQYLFSRKSVLRVVQAGLWPSTKSQLKNKQTWKKHTKEKQQHSRCCVCLADRRWSVHSFICTAIMNFCGMSWISAFFCCLFVKSTTVMLSIVVATIYVFIIIIVVAMSGSIVVFVRILLCTKPTTTTNVHIAS